MPLRLYHPQTVCMHNNSSSSNNNNNNNTFTWLLLLLPMRLLRRNSTMCLQAAVAAAPVAQVASQPQESHRLLLPWAHGVNRQLLGLVPPIQACLMINPPLQPLRLRLLLPMVVSALRQLQVPPTPLKEDWSSSCHILLLHLQQMPLQRPQQRQEDHKRHGTRRIKRMLRVDSSTL
jgi:hypothetical protein